ncbi:D-sedoheptulose 7-phosphate isomerase [Chitinophaga pendula]|uniref:D-sedoheptulose-7-phosphate isomerase n=1 Tax=Chitinophaga TaxID=79328 RepID=UPI0018DF2983|nr:D-sedoheptulose 7-phosphate isomerase [Chitinophaga pendula]UCJ08856.1 D-sedoheptulose 7-phosphate isomerase [Chitinophaga pendula]
MNLTEKIQQTIQESIAVKQAIISNTELVATIEEVAKVITRSLRNGNKILFCGNGGSAADAQHLAAEFSGRFYKDRTPLYAEALHCNTSYLTAVGNDYGYDQVYARILSGIGQPGDVLVGISTSGNSANILEAYKVAKEKGMIVVSMTGETGGKMKADSNFLLNMPSTDTPRIQESHITVGHIICELVETTLFP